jgi:hypothetical protein
MGFYGGLMGFNMIPSGKRLQVAMEN